MSRFMRQSKYRHVFAEKTKRENCYENIKVSSTAWDTDLVQAGGTYLSINWQVAGGGAFAILPIPSAFAPSTAPTGSAFPNKLPDILPLARGHSAPVLDTAWSPFDDSVVASGAEDGKICLWKVAPGDFEGWSEEGFVAKDWAPEAKMSAGGRKVGQVMFHPTASHVLASASGDHVVRLWDVSHTEAPKISLDAHGDSIQSFTWNMTGTLLVTTSRDKKLRMFDPRAGSAPVRTADGHAGVKGSRVVWLGHHDRIVTTGFSKTSDRQVNLWETGGLTQLKSITIDQSSGVMMPFYSEANDLLWLAGKGDGNIRYYEYEADNLHFLSEHASKDPQRGLTFSPRRSLDVNANEIARGYKLSGQVLEPLAFVVPRKAENFQADIFPPALSADAALTAADWFGGKTADPKFIALDGSSSTAPPTVAAVREVPVKSQTAPAFLPSPAAEIPISTHAASTPATPAPAKSPVPSRKQSADNLPKMEDLEIAEEASEDEAPAAAAAPEPSVPTAVEYVAPSDGAEVASLKKENDALTIELRDSRAKIRALELKVETMQANAHKIAKQLASLDV